MTSPASIQEHANRTRDPWTHRLGMLAWAPLPFDDNTQHCQTMNTPYVTSCPPLLGNEWPCILYPSWSNAILRSGLVTNEDAVRLIGCKKKVAVKDLGKNRVPSRLALGSGLNGSKYRPKVVAYYLGYGDDPAWCSVNVQRLKEYTLDSCVEKLRAINNSCEHPPHEKDCLVQHKMLLLAMYEASIVMERPDYDPFNICSKYGLINLRQSEKRKIDDQESDEEKLTPEYFDEWRVGGDSQIDTQTQSFSCPLKS